MRLASTISSVIMWPLGTCFMESADYLTVYWEDEGRLLRAAEERPTILAVFLDGDVY